MHNDPDQTLDLPTDAPVFQSPSSGQDTKPSSPASDEPARDLDAVALPLRPLPPGEPSERVFGVGMVVALLIALGLAVARSDWWL